MRIEPISPGLRSVRRDNVPLHTRHSRGEFIGRHRHNNAYAALVLSGGYVEAGDSGRHRLNAGDVLFHCAFESHLNRFEGICAQVLNLPLPSSWKGPTRGRTGDADLIATIAERDLREAVSTLVAEMTAAAPAAEDWPDLLASDLINDPALSLGAWAARHGIHSGSLSRGFRQQFGITAAEFRSIARTRQAMEQIADHPLSEVAAASGFADQAHMTREVRRFTGLSPTELRTHLSV